MLWWLKEIFNFKLDKVQTEGGREVRYVKEPEVGLIAECKDLAQND